MAKNSNACFSSKSVCSSSKSQVFVRNQQIVLNDLIFEGGSGVRDWANLQQRLRFIADLFRTYGEEKCLFDPLKTDTTAADS
jgi:hypothetical protein